MYVEILIIGILVFTILTVNGYVKPNKFIYDNQDLFMKLKETDYDFLVKAKYGDGVDADVLYQKRIKTGMITIIACVFIQTPSPFGYSLLSKRESFSLCYSICY